LFGSLFGKKKKKPPSSDSLVDSIKDIVVGDVFTIADLSIEYEDSYFIIEKINRYSSVGGDWYEFEGVDGDQKIWLYWSDQGGLFTTVMLDDRPLGLSSLGLDSDELFRIDEEESIDNYVTIEAVQYYYRHSAEAYYYQDNKGNGDGFYLWDFASEDGSRMLSIDKWEGLPFQGHFTEVVPPESVTAYKR